MSDEAQGPGPSSIMRAVSAWQQARERLAADADLADDENAILHALNADPNTLTPDELLARLVRALNICMLRTQEGQELVAQARARQNRYAKRAVVIRTELFDLMQIFGRKTFRAPDGTLSMRAGVPSALITDEAMLPDEYCKVVRSPDRSLILADLQQGVVIDGAVLSNGAPTVALRRSRDFDVAAEIVAEDDTATEE